MQCIKHPLATFEQKLSLSGSQVPKRVYILATGREPSPFPHFAARFKDDKDWHVRYVAGANKFGWTANSVADSPPAEWSVVTVDLFKDFGAREIHGIHPEWPIRKRGDSRIEETF